ncbi:hypothetical protein [Cytobacillus oceanisediminis]|uniref:hypothetical protein n=1 Tax=Cytobacillus oceanisediminis TaxID=665099 RepID=UPI002494DC21|nr:hypothetical protein [Cytobacillus oceanisediminis]
MVLDEFFFFQNSSYLVIDEPFLIAFQFIGHFVMFSGQIFNISVTFPDYRSLRAALRFHY